MIALSNPVLNLLPTWAWVLLVAGAWTGCVLGLVALCGWITAKDQEMADALEQMHDQPPEWTTTADERLRQGLSACHGKEDPMRFSMDEPDGDRYDDKPVDVQDLPLDGLPWGWSVDPAERAVHAAIDAFGTLEKELAKTSTVERALQLRRMLSSVYRHADRIALAATTKVEDLVS